MAIIRPYQSLLQFSDPAPYDIHIPVLGRTVRPTLSRNPVRYHPPTEDTAQEGFTPRDPLGPISEDSLLRMRATANAQLNALDANIEGMVFQSSLDALERGNRQVEEERARKASEVSEKQTANEQDEKPERPAIALHAGRDSDRVSPRGPIPKPAGFGLFLEPGLNYGRAESDGTFQPSRNASTRSMGMTSAGTQGLGRFRVGSLLAFNGNPVALYGRSAMMGGFAANTLDPIRSVTFSQVS
jgi:hypothetical protein